jgi:hypothetical protein
MSNSYSSYDAWKCPSCGTLMKYDPARDMWTCGAGFQVTREVIEDASANEFIHVAIKWHDNRMDLYDWIKHQAEEFRKKG